MARVEITATTDITKVLAALKEVSPKLARESRRALRRSGDLIIEAQGRILDEEVGGNVTKTNYKVRAGLKRGGYRRGPNVALYGGMVIDTVDSEAASRSRGRGSRQEIKSGLRTRVTTPKSGAKVRIVTTTGELRKAMNTKKFRHPVFNTGQFVEQAGTQYFRRGVAEKYDETRELVIEAVNDMVAHINNT